MRNSAAASAGAVDTRSLAQGSLRNGKIDVSAPVRAASADLSALYLALMDADDRADAQALAQIGWTLFATASAAEQAQYETVGLLKDLRLAARVATAGEGSPASLALLRRVLGQHGWLPPAGATPLQVLAAPAR